jgi:two-component system, LytTR family, response regulator AlgR
MIDDASEPARPMLRTLVADGDEASAARLQIMLGVFDNVELIGAAQSADQAIRLNEALSPDLILMSVTLPPRTGIDVANHIKNDREPPAIIFLSASQQSAFEAFEAGATDFLLKPIHEDRLSTALQRVSAQRSPRPIPAPYLSKFWVQQRNARICVDSDEICLIEAQGDYVILHTPETNYMVHKTIKQLIQHLDPSQFVRIHRSTVVRRDKIQALVHRTASNWAVDLGNGRILAIGKTFLASVKALTANA